MQKNRRWKSKAMYSSDVWVGYGAAISEEYIITAGAVVSKKVFRKLFFWGGVFVRMMRFWYDELVVDQMAKFDWSAVDDSLIFGATLPLLASDCGVGC